MTDPIHIPIRQATTNHAHDDDLIQWYLRQYANVPRSEPAMSMEAWSEAQEWAFYNLNLKRFDSVDLNILTLEEEWNAFGMEERKCVHTRAYSCATTEYGHVLGEVIILYRNENDCRGLVIGYNGNCYSFTHAHEGGSELATLYRIDSTLFMELLNFVWEIHS